jgi:hypothetical protein
VLLVKVNVKYAGGEGHKIIASVLKKQEKCERSSLFQIRNYLPFVVCFLSCPADGQSSVGPGLVVKRRYMLGYVVREQRILRLCRVVEMFIEYAVTAEYTSF